MENIKFIFKCEYNEADLPYLKELMKDVLKKGPRGDRDDEHIKKKARAEIKEIINKDEVEVEIFKYWSGDRVFFRLKGMDNSFILRYVDATMGRTKCKIVWDLFYSVAEGNVLCGYNLRECAESKLDRSLFRNVDVFGVI